MYILKKINQLSHDVGLYIKIFNEVQTLGHFDLPIYPIV